MAYGITRGSIPPKRLTRVRNAAGRHALAEAPEEKGPLGPAGRAAKILAVTLAIMIALTLSCTPRALATTGVTSNLDVDMDYYWASNQSHSKHYLHKLGDWWVYCVDPYNGFFEGYTYTGEYPVKTGKLSQ